MPEIDTRMTNAAPQSFLPVHPAAIPDFSGWEFADVDFSNTSKTILIGLLCRDTGDRAQVFLEGVREFDCTRARQKNVVHDVRLFESDDHSEALQRCLEILQIDASVFGNDGEPRRIVYIRAEVGMELACCCAALSYRIYAAH